MSKLMSRRPPSKGRTTEHKPKHHEAPRSARSHHAALLTQWVGAMGRGGLEQHPCVGPERAEFVLPGCAVFAAIQRLWPAPQVVVADRGLREGMLLRLMRAPRRAGRVNVLGAAGHLRRTPRWQPAPTTLGFRRVDPARVAFYDVGQPPPSVGR